MFVYDESLSRPSLSPWGVEVKKRLIELNMRQVELLRLLSEAGVKLNRPTLTNLFYGRGSQSRQTEIAKINEILGIPVKESESA